MKWIITRVVRSEMPVKRTGRARRRRVGNFGIGEGLTRKMIAEIELERKRCAEGSINGQEKKVMKGQR